MGSSNDVIQSNRQSNVKHEKIANSKQGSNKTTNPVDRSNEFSKSAQLMIPCYFKPNTFIFIACSGFLLFGYLNMKTLTSMDETTTINNKPSELKLFAGFLIAISSYMLLLK